MKFLSGKILILAVIVLIGLGFVFIRSTNNNQPITQTPTATPQVTQISPSGPDTRSWQTATDAAQHVTFKYPELSTKYVTATDWPPKILVKKGSFTCSQAGSENDSTGKTEKVTVNGHTYCVTEETEGAAGSIYTQYTHVFQKDQNIITFIFSLRFVQCGNYPDTEMQACDLQRRNFDINTIVDEITQTIQISK